MDTINFSPGSIVRARGREWIVLSGSTPDILRLRPVSGSEEDGTVLHVALERAPVAPARFPLPQLDQRAGHDAALLLRDALLLSMRRGAGPFRSFGQISVEPRAYQLVPLLMAMQLDPIRLLIADDVGIGKTIEAALIARELLDRGEADRFVVLCPPHLVDQWVSELDVHFHIRATAVTAASAGRLERGMLQGDSIFNVHPVCVVSLDYIKSQSRRDRFLNDCPSLVIVDEAHTCAGAGQGRHQRYELLRAIATSGDRHLVMLTATPHSGDEEAFYRLLGLLDPTFVGLANPDGPDRDKLRDKLSRHFVQRRRPDIAEWKESGLFPRRETAELTYKLTGKWLELFDRVLDYCEALVAGAGSDERKRRLTFWGTLALMRCVSSSPAAAVQALRTRANARELLDEEELLEDRVFDGTSDALVADDVEPAAPVSDGSLDDLIARAEALLGQSGDPKLKRLVDHVKELLDAGCNPVIFCRYIGTAGYVARELKDRWKGVTVDVVTGELSSEEREEKVALLGEAERCVLVATDCLSEGVNLQDSFDAVVHYDLSWNPTRHEQREGRVDRFGQKEPIVRATLLYGENNPVDGAILEVNLRKADAIRKELGVPVPIPDEGHRLTQALMKAVLLRKHGDRQQRSFDFAATPEGQEIATIWQDAAEKAKRNLTVFAQRRLRPSDVLPEWQRTRAALGAREDVERFVSRALARLGAGLEKQGRGWKAPLTALPDEVKDRLDAEGLSGAPRIAFSYPAPAGCRAVERAHPLVSIIADTLLERTLAAVSAEDAAGDPSVLGRIGCWTSAAVDVRTTIALLRLRHHLTTQTHKGTRTLLVEEAAAVSFGGRDGRVVTDGAEVLALLLAPPVGDPADAVKERMAKAALALATERAADLDAVAERRAAALLADHRRVREAAQARGTYAVRAQLPVDVIGLYVLLPKAD